MLARATQGQGRRRRLSLSTQGSLKQRLGLAGAVVRVAGAVTRDGIHPPLPHTATDVPAHIRHITPTWLTVALQATLPGTVVASVSADGDSSGTSVRARLHLHYRTPGVDQPATLFAKSTPTLVTRIANGLTKTAPTEAGFYRHLRPQLTLEAPRGYYNAFDERSWRSIQIIEDLVATKGATFCAPDRSVSREDAEQIVRQLATLHGQGLPLPEVCAERPRWLSTYPEWWQNALQVVGVKRSHLRGVAAAVDKGVLPAELRGRGPDLWSAFLRSVEAHRDLPATLIHGDVHLGNWYITDEGVMGLCDWQCVSVGHWSRDLAYALSSTLEIEQRRSWEQYLIRAYLDQLHQNGFTRIDFAYAWQLYRHQLLGALVMWTPTYRPPPLMPDVQPVAVTEEMLRRIGTAIVDLESLSA